MKDILHKLLIIIIASAGFLSLASLLRAGSCTADRVWLSLKAGGLKKNISAVEYIPPQASDTGLLSLGHTPRKLTIKDFEHIYIDGAEYDFPLKLSELPDNFTVVYDGTFSKTDPETNEIIKCGHSYIVYCNGIEWATAVSDSDSPQPESDPCVNSLFFYNIEKNPVAPRTVFCGFDSAHLDAQAFSDAYLSSGPEYIMTRYKVEEGGRIGSVNISRNRDGGDSKFLYIELTDEKYSRDDGEKWEFTESEYRIPEGYIIDGETYIDIPEDAENILTVLDMVTVDGADVTLGCSLNDFLAAFDGRAV